LSILLGGTAPPRLLLALVAGAYLSIPAGIAAALLPWPTLIVILTLPLAVRQIRLVFRERDPKRLNEAWFLGVKLMTAFGVLFVAGLLVGVWLR
jgi:1,4-dihydroxy-2-naphthoate octaprenyltransferase